MNKEKLCPPPNEFDILLDLKYTQPGPRSHEHTPAIHGMWVINADRFTTHYTGQHPLPGDQFPTSSDEGIPIADRSPLLPTNIEECGAAKVFSID